MGFFNIDAGGSLGGSVTPPQTDPDDGLGDLGDQGGGGEGNEPTGNEPASGSSTASAPTISFTPDDLASAIAKAFPQVQGGGQPQQTKQLTPEELRKQLKYWEPDDNWFKDFGDLDKQKDAVLGMRDGIFAHAFEVAKAMIQQEMGPLKQQLGGFQSWQQEQQNAKLVEGFNTSFKQLATPELAQLREMVTAHLVQQGATFKTTGEMYKAIADNMSAVIKQHKPDFVLDTSSGGSTPPKANPNAIKPAPKRGGGGGGSNGGGGEGDRSGRPLAVSLLPPIKPR